MESTDEIRTMVMTREDLPILERFLAHYGESFEPGRPSRATFDEFIHLDSAWCILALADEEPIGLCVAVRIPKLDTRTGFLFIDEIYVAEPWRRFGAGRRLIAHAEKLAKERRLAGIRLLARPVDEAAQAFYAALGYAGSVTLFHERLFVQGADQI